MLAISCSHKATPLACHNAWDLTTQLSKNFYFPWKANIDIFKGEYVYVHETLIS